MASAQWILLVGALLLRALLQGIRGMLLSIPVTVIIKELAQHVEQLEPVAELPGDQAPGRERITRFGNGPMRS